MTSVRFARNFEDPAGSPIRELFGYLSRPGIVSFAGGYPSPDLLDAQGLEEASRMTWLDCAAALQYGPTEGSPRLREALAELTRQRGIACDAKDLVVTAGSQQAFDILVRILIEPGDVALVEAPAYSAAIQSLRLAGANVLQVAMDEDGMRVDMLAQILRDAPASSRPKLIYTVPTFSNPAGTLLPAPRREVLVRLAIEYGIVVVEDDPYGELHFGAPAPATLYAIGQRLAPASNPVVYLSSLSKTVAPSLRIGWMVGPPEVLRRGAIAKQTMDLCTSPLAQDIAANYLALGRYDASVARARAGYFARMDAMAREIDRRMQGRLSFVRPAGGMFVWARATAPVDSQQLFHAAVEAGVLYVPGAAFFAQASQPGTMRLSYAAPDEPAIRQGITRLSQAFDQVQGAMQ
ncbi:MAG: PLP-dependent aminotransferase family protein [Pseudomonadota bacterium]